MLSKLLVNKSNKKVGHQYWTSNTSLEYVY